MFPDLSGLTIPLFAVLWLAKALAGLALYRMIRWRRAEATTRNKRT